jgi:hypothetical protein
VLTPQIEPLVPTPGLCWLEAPEERSPAFLPAFARVSFAIQSALRSRVPEAYFDDIRSFEDTKLAFPMLVYQASEPFRCRIRTDLTYDVLNPRTIARLLRSAKLGLPDLLARVENRLTVAGWSEESIKPYRARKAVDMISSVQDLAKSRKNLYLLVRAEGVLMDAMIELGGLGQVTARQQARKIGSFQKKWAYQLRRLYPGTDFLWLGPILLNAGSEALMSFLLEASKPFAGIPRPPEPA